jgi:hypothetical protein
MIMIDCHSLLPDLPVRTLHLQRAGDVPAGEYGLIECFCNEIDCDCRRVMISVISAATNEIVAHISYGWESVDFYLKWTGNLSDAKDCIGPYLDPLNEQSSYAPIFLTLFKNYVMQDKAYLERVKQHYALFKAALKRKSSPLSLVPERKPKKRHRK